MSAQQHPLLLGIDIGGTSLRLALADSSGHITKQRKLPSPKRETPDVMIKSISRAAREMLSDIGCASIATVGVACPGPVDFSLGLIMNPPNLPQFHTVPLRDLLEQELGAPVTIENDANAAALAEHRLGSGQSLQDMVYVTVSTGIGGGIIAGGKLYHGARGGAGEMGHMTIEVNGPLCGCGQRGCWESLASGTAIAREAIHRLQQEESVLSQVARNKPQSLDAQVLHQAALQGDRVSQEILAQAASYLGIGLANIVNIFNPQLVVLGGGLTQIGDQFLAPAFRICRERAFPLHASDLRLGVTTLGDEIALLGALELAQELRNKSS